MRRCIIVIELESAAFAQPPENDTELRRILERASQHVSYAPLTSGSGWDLRDSNGNTVGTMSIGEPEPSDIDELYGR